MCPSRASADGSTNDGTPRRGVSTEERRKLRSLLCGAEAAPPEVVSSVPVGRRARRAPPPPRPWQASDLLRCGATSLPGSLRRSSAHVEAMSGAVAAACEGNIGRHHECAAKKSPAQKGATCLSLAWWWWCGHNLYDRVSVQERMHMQLLKNQTGARARAPSAGLTSQKKSYVRCLQVQVPGVFRADLITES